MKLIVILLLCSLSIATANQVVAGSGATYSRAAITSVSITQNLGIGEEVSIESEIDSEYCLYFVLTGVDNAPRCSGQHIAVDYTSGPRAPLYISAHQLLI